MNKYSTDVVIRVWDDSSGCRVEIGPDGDGLELVEIRYYEKDREPLARITIMPEYAEKVHAALGKYLRETHNAAAQGQGHQGTLIRGQ